MPLLDHFHEPLVSQRSWESFNTVWVVCISEYLHKILPARFFAEVQTHLGPHVEADVAEFEELYEPDGEGADNGDGGVAVQTFAPPVATHTIAAVFPDDIEIQIRDKRRDYRLVAVVEMVSPANKDREANRRAFAAKVCAYLAKGIGVAVVDIVSSYHNNLHNELMDLMQMDEKYLIEDDQSLYAAAYRPVRRTEKNLIDIWLEELAIDGPLPTLPLGLLGNGVIPLDLNSTYEIARSRSRM